MDAAELTGWIKREATTLGFSYCGIAAAAELTEDARKLEAWLKQGMHGDMHYMERHFDLRIDPRKLVPGAKSVITLMLNYFPQEQANEGGPLISKYAWGVDYHDVIREKLKTLLLHMQTKVGAVEGRGFVDSAPVLERSWAVRSGLGWVGKNGNLINKQSGSFFFLATLITDLVLVPDPSFTKDFCGTCTKCIDACPTEAILPNKTVDGSKCISYFTIELKDVLKQDRLHGSNDQWLFGCDVCQDVCPWNRFSQPHQEAAFTPIPELLVWNQNDWESLTEASFRELFKRSPIKRAKFAGIQRNLRWLKKRP
jgi:epoxyqueuosine reductase